MKSRLHVRLALKGRHVIAQGAALGVQAPIECPALKERNNCRHPHTALSGLSHLDCRITQGFALGYRIPAFQARRQRYHGGARPPAAFTLFELILAIALSAALLSLIGTAINLYLVRVDASRLRVEEAQLARSILSMIADDIRATTVYQPQDTSAIAELMAKSSPFDVDSIDKPNETTGGTSRPGGTSGTSGTTGATKISSSSSNMPTTQLAQASSSSTESQSESDTTMPLGLSGTLEELYVDATRLPKQEELFTSVTGYTNAASPTAGTASGAIAPSGAPPPSDLKTVHYFVRPGEAIAAGSAAATSLDPQTQSRAGGLVRQEIPRALRLMAEQTGDSAATDSGAALVAPEVVRIEFRYFGSSEVADVWDMKENKSLPTAVEVCVWLRNAGSADAPIASSYDTANLANTARQYRRVVFLPMAEAMNSNQLNSSSESSSSSTTSSSSTSSSGSGSSFDQP